MSRRHVTYTTVPGATVRVMRAGGSVKETLYAASSGSTQVANPMTAGQDGTVSAYVEGSDLVDLLVVAPAADPYSVTDVFVGSAGGGGGTPAGVPIVRAFPFAFDTPDLLTGHAVYTPTVGDVLLDAWFDITQAWDGTAPLADVGLLPGGSHIADISGWFNLAAGQAVDLTTENSNDRGLYHSYNETSLDHAVSILQSAAYMLKVDGAGPGLTPATNALGRGVRVVPAVLPAADPIKIVVSQDGTVTGDDPGSTQGAAVLYLVTATPA